jgi:O-antigen/teichoic acid export membrane protein
MRKRGATIPASALWNDAGMEDATSAAASVTRAHAGRDVVAQMVLRGANLVLGLAVTLVLVRTLGSDGFGQWSTLLAVLGIVGYFGSMGLDRVAVERAATEPAEAPSWVGALATLRLALSIPVTFVSIAVCFWVADDSAMRIAAVAVGAALPSSALSTVRIVFQLRVRNALITAIEVANGIVWGGAVFLVAVLDGGLVAVAIAFLVVTTLTNVAQTVLALRAAPVRFRGTRRLWRPLLRLGLPIGIGGLLSRGYGSIDQVIVFELAGSHDAGLYGAVYRIYERLLFVPGSVMTTLFPILVTARNADPERLRRLVRMGGDYLVLLSLPALAIALAGPEQIVDLLLGDEFSEAAPALPMLMASFVVVSLGFLGGYLVIALELQKAFVWLALAALVFNVALNLVLVPVWGFIAAAAITLATEVLVTAVTLIVVCRRIGTPPAGARLVGIVLAAAIAGVLGWGLRIAGVPVLAWTAAAAAVYPLLLLAFGVVHPREIRALLVRRAAAS